MDDLIHFVHPVSGKALCNVDIGDLRYIGIRAKADDCCPVCWERRRRHYRTKKAVDRGVARQQRKQEPKREPVQVRDSKTAQYELF